MSLSQSEIKKPYFVTIFLVLSLLFLVGCEQPPLPEPNSEGALLYVEKCVLCHPARHPQILSSKLWERKIKLMEKKVLKSGIREPLTDKELAIILGYLKKHARQKGY